MIVSGDVSDCGEAVNITVYRLIQECLTNVIRHAEASSVAVEIERRDDAVWISVTDNGKGLGERNDTESARFGLMGMRERVQALGGEFRLDSRPGRGLKVEASIPASWPRNDTATEIAAQAEKATAK